MNKELIILGHSNPDVDSIISGYLLEKILRKAGFQARFIIPDAKIEKQTYTICLKYGVDPKQFMDSLPETYSNYFLVDHCKREVFGKIIGIIDHHPSDISETPSFYVNQTQTSTAMLIFNYGWMYLEPNDEKLVIIANLVDSAGFNSSRIYQEDITWTKKTCDIHDFNYDKLYNEGLCLTDFNDSDEAIKNGYIEFEIEQKRIKSSYVQYFNLEEETLNSLLKKIKKNNSGDYLFLAHNMKEMKSTIYYFEDANIKKYEKYNNYTPRSEVIKAYLKEISSGKEKNNT